ncbi:MAG TPA: universal stress protein [Steroidobacteraceae bacterium]|nr:universal stress protein [Steroidobacteraceae bacterium]
MRSIRKILVGVRDPRAKRLPAVEKAAQLALAFGAQIELFHALRLPSSLGLDALGAQYLPQIEHDEQVRLKSWLEAVAEPLRDRGIVVTTHASWDLPAGEAVVRRASRVNADLIVVDCHAGAHRGAWLLRLPDWDVLRYSPVPVLLVKNKQPYRKPCLLAAVDPSHAFAKPAKLDAEILRIADLFRKQLRGKLHAVHAFVPTPIDAKPSELLDPEATHILEARAKERARALLQPLLKNVQVGRTARHLVGEHPISGIPRLARHIGCDIVVMGAVSRSGLKRIFIGNTAERILDALDCDVLVVKPPGFVSRLPLAARAAVPTRRVTRRAA